MSLFKEEATLVSGCADIRAVYAKPHWKTHNNDLCIVWRSADEAWVYAHVKERIKRHDGVSIRVTFTLQSDGQVHRPSHGVQTAWDLERIGVYIPKRKGLTMVKNVDYIGRNYSVVACSYASSGDTRYCFKADLSLGDIEEGSRLVVESAKGYSVVTAHIQYTLDDTLTSREALASFNAAKAWVVDVVDETKHNARKEATARKELITTKLREAREAMEEEAIWATLASHNPQAKALLEQLKEVNNI